MNAEYLLAKPFELLIGKCEFFLEYCIFVTERGDLRCNILFRHKAPLRS